jgi:hypothetical protein
MEQNILITEFRHFALLARNKGCRIIETGLKCLWRETEFHFQMLNLMDSLSVFHTNILLRRGIQGVAGGKVSILGGHCIGHSKKKIVYVCPIPNGFRDTAILLYYTLYTVH